MRPRLIVDTVRLAKLLPQFLRQVRRQRRKQQRGGLAAPRAAQRRRRRRPLIQQIVLMLHQAGDRRMELQGGEIIADPLDRAMDQSPQTRGRVHLP